MRPTAVSTLPPFQDGGRLYDVITTKFYFFNSQLCVTMEPKAIEFGK